MPVSHVHSPIFTRSQVVSLNASPHATSGNATGPSASREYHCTDEPMVVASAWSSAVLSPVSARLSRP